MTYRDLTIWKQARTAVISVHAMSLTLPAFETYEEGSQIRRAVKSVRSCIVEGFGRRQYKQDWLKYLRHALASNDETIDHLDILWETGSLKDEKCYRQIMAELTSLGKMLNKFISSVESQHLSEK